MYTSSSARSAKLSLRATSSFERSFRSVGHFLLANGSTFAIQYRSFAIRLPMWGVLKKATALGIGEIHSYRFCSRALTRAAFSTMPPRLWQMNRMGRWDGRRRRSSSRRESKASPISHMLAMQSSQNGLPVSYPQVKIRALGQRSLRKSLTQIGPGPAALPSTLPFQVSRGWPSKPWMAMMLHQAVSDTMRRFFGKP